MSYKVKEVADISGISIRTLHHYDEIGLLKPAAVTKAGYRQYNESDLERLQQILFFKELEFSLKEIKDIIDSPNYDKKAALHSHKKLLSERRMRLGKLIKLADKTIRSIDKGVKMAGKDTFGAFDESKIEEYKEEAKQRWGNTPEYKESERKTSKYTKEDWDKIKAEQEVIYNGIAALMDKGPSDSEVQAFIRKHHQSINKYFYSCSLEVYRGLGDLYVNDKRFTAFYEKIKPGMAKFMKAAMHIYCEKYQY